MCKNNNGFRSNRVSVFVLTLLLCLGALSGCGRENNASPEPTVSAAPTQEVTPTGTPVPTLSPTSVVPFVKQAYETCGRDDVYRVPVAELSDGWDVMSSKFAGEYAALWLTRDEGGGMTEDLIVLLRPEVTSEQYRMKPAFTAGNFCVLSDGTVIVSEVGTLVMHVFNNTLTEIRTIPVSGDKGTGVIGFGEDGTVWTTDPQDAKLIATDLQGQPAGEYAYDPQFTVRQYAGRIDNRECFLVSTADEKHEQCFLYLPSEGEIEVRKADDPEFAGEWSVGQNAPKSGWSMLQSDSTWFFHRPGYGMEGIAFPKSNLRESAGVIQNDRLCATSSRTFDDGSAVQEYRLYDIKKGTVSDPLSDAELAGCASLSARGIIGESTVVFAAEQDGGGKTVLLWTAGEKSAPVEGFCDFSAGSPEAVLEKNLAELRETCGIEITPDLADVEANTMLGEVMVRIATANIFRIAVKNNPGVLKAASDDRIRPENMRSNDGAHYTFNPHVMSPYLGKEHGDATETFFAYVDALRAGEDRFPCPDADTMFWCKTLLAGICFPIADLFTDCDYLGDGQAAIRYLIPKEEFLQKEREFEDWICAILNDVLEDDYTDIEKCLAIYEFLTEYCVYDDEMLEHNSEYEWIIKQSPYRVLTEKKGICEEIASLYVYLLMQCGVSADVEDGVPVDPDDVTHAWVYLELDGQGYLIDPTWGLTANREPDLTYFLFTDDLRETRDGYIAASFGIGGAGFYESRKKYSFDADDTRYKDLWTGRYVAFDQETKSIYYMDPDGNLQRFDYGK